MKRIHCIIAAVMTVAAGCTADRHYGQKMENDILCETAWFSYPNEDRATRTNLCEVNYYVLGDTLFTSEKYHFVTLGYEGETDPEMHYMEIVYFDKMQNPDTDGWYHIVLNRNDIYREPNTRLTSIVLRSYIGDKYDYKDSSKPHVNAYLFDIAKDNAELTPQLKKLLPIIQ